MANIIDSNTIFCLRGDSYLDISSSPMTTNSNQANFPAITNKQLVFTGNTTDSSFTFGTTKTLPGDFTFETWFNAQSYDGFNLFANRATETCFIIGHKTASETRIGTWIGPKDNWGQPSAHYFGSITMNVNNHMAYVRKGTTHYAFLNGKLISTVNVSSPPTLGLNNFNIGQTANFKVWNARISNVARYTADFTPDPSPYTSVAISEFSYTDGALNLVVTKNTNETIHKIEVLVNGSVVKTYNSQTLNFGDTVAVDDYLIYGANIIEAKAYYYDNNYFISKSLSVEKSIEKLTNNATFEDIMTQTDKIKSNISSMNNLLAATLASKGISTGSDPKMFHLIKLVGQMSNTNSSEITGYLNQISELTSQNDSLTSQLSNKDLEIDNAKVLLVSKLTSKGLSCTVNQSFTDLITLIDSLAVKQSPILYDAGNEYSSITGGWGIRVVASNGQTAATKRTSDMYLAGTGNLSCAFRAYAYTVNKIDVTNIKKIYVNVTTSGLGASGGYSSAVSLELADKTTSSGVNDLGSIAKSFTTTSNGARTVELDVSTLTGSYHVRVRADYGWYPNYPAGSAVITKVWYE